jgi:Predicted pyridoxal phosphate-dependent enzyme apparently involved in regulation of cell wall biogenesis
VLPQADSGDRHGWQAYVIQLERRDEALESLRAQGIQCQIGTYALHRLGAYREQGSFPGARCRLRAAPRAASIRG